VDECGRNPMAAKLFTIPSVTKLHFFENVITVSQDGDGDWEDMEDDVIETVQEMIATHDPNFKEGIDEDDRRAQLPEQVKKIEEILDRTIRPGLQGDGGDILVIRYDEVAKIVYVRYQGACTTCPSSSMGTLMAIKNFLRDEFDSEIEVKTFEEGAHAGTT
jgi:NFU1 iron-sulfur cluster scaffold homolog, mitochondrial